MALRDLNTEYLGVSVDDRDPQAIFDKMLSTAEERLGGAWVPRNGSVETAIMEAGAVGMSDLIYAANRLLGALTEALINMYGVTRDPGSPASGLVRLTLAEPGPMSVDEGSTFRVGDTLLVSTAPVSTLGAPTLDVPVAALEAGGWLNDLEPGTPVDPVAVLPNVAACELLGLSGGSEPESDLEFLSRASARFARVSSSLVRDGDFAAFALESPKVGRALAVDRYFHGDPGDPGDHDGAVSVYLYGKGATLDPASLGEFQESMSEAAASILRVIVQPAAPVVMNVAAELSVADGFDPDEVQAAVQSALSAAWSWQFSGFGFPVDPLDVQEVIESVPGVDSVSSVSSPISEVTPGFSEFVVLGSVTLAVV